MQSMITAGNFFILFPLNFAYAFLEEIWNHFGWINFKNAAATKEKVLKLKINAAYNPHITTHIENVQRPYYCD